MFRLAILAPAMALLAFASDYEAAARKAGKWLDEQKLADSPNLYSGTSGVALYYLELYRATGDRAALGQLEKIGDRLIESAKAEKSGGLYSGTAGLGFVLTEIWKSTKQERFKKAAIAIVEGIQS